MLAELLAQRDKLAQRIEYECQTANGEKGDFVTKKEYVSLEQENKKLRYRIGHLLTSLDSFEKTATK